MEAPGTNDAPPPYGPTREELLRLIG